MNAAALKISTAAAPTNWSEWIRADQAALLMDLSPRQLRRRCGDELAALGAAVKAIAPGDSQVSWWVRRDHDDRLGRKSKGASVATLESQGVPARKAHDARQRALCVHELREARVNAGAKNLSEKDWLDAFLLNLRERFSGISISRSAIYRWDQRYQKSEHLIRLVDNRGGHARQLTSPECWRFFERLYLDDRQPSVAECWRKTLLHAKDHDLTWCKKRTCEVQLNTRIAPSKQAFHRDRALYNSRFLPTLQQDSERFGAGEYWVADHTTLDFEVRIGERAFRPTLTTFQDWRTRKIVGWCMCETPNSDTILLALRDGLLDESNMGGPNHVGFDNGKDFDSWMFDGRTKAERRKENRTGFAMNEGTFAGILHELQIRIHFSPPYSPNGKSRQERWYGTLHAQLCRSMPSYVGKDPASKPDGLQARRKAGLAPSWAEARERIGAYIEAYNASPEHQISDLVDDAGTRLSPAAAMATWRDTLRAYNRDALELLLLHHQRPTTVTKRGVSVQIRGTQHHYGMMHPDLIAYQGTGRKIRAAYDPRDVRQISVFDDATSQLICIAPHNEIGGQDGAVGTEQMARFKRKLKSHHKTLKDAGLGALAPSLSALEMMADRDDLPDVAEPTTSTVAPVTTHYDDQGPALDRERMKQAAGAEYLDTPSDDDAHDILAALDEPDPSDAAGPVGRIGFGDAPGLVAPHAEPVEADANDDPFASLDDALTTDFDVTDDADTHADDDDADWGDDL